MRSILCIPLWLWLSACATHTVRCDAHLRPINGTVAAAAASSS